MDTHGSNGARARSARIRSSHDYEATELDSMWRRARALEERAARPARMARVYAILVRVRVRRAEVRGHEELGVAETAEGIAGAS
jgi:hypothetical protein